MDSLEILKGGNVSQRKVSESIYKLGVMQDLSDYTPTICGTYPIDIYTATSDIDIIMYVHDLKAFGAKLKSLYGHLDSYTLKKKIIRGQEVVKANFFFQGFPFELFGQAVPVSKQYAYLHMVIEQYLLGKNPNLKEKIRALKKEGWKTEPAFCNVLGIEGDPYEQLISYGKREGII